MTMTGLRVVSILASTISGAVVVGGAVSPVASAASSPLPSPPACANPVATWTVAQQVEQLVMVSGEFSDLPASAPEARAGAGGFVLFGQPAAGSGPGIAAGLSDLQADAVAAGQVIPWMSTDEEGGNVARLANVIGALPTPRQMAARWTTAQVTSQLAAHGAAMRALGITMDLAPVLDTASPSDPYADESDRSFSETPQVASAYGTAFARGLERVGVVPVVKHFPGLGHAVGNTDTGTANDPPLSTLEAQDLVAFEGAIGAGLPVVMVGHPVVPGLSGGLPASLSAATYSLLRQTLHFGGVAMTDALGAGAIVDAGYSEASAAVTAVEAGADMVLIDASDWSSVVNALEQAVAGGSLSLSRVDGSVARILAAKGVPTCPVVGMAATTSGYWIAGTGGAVAPFGAAGYGSVTGAHLTQPVVAIAPVPAGGGYWLAAADGGVFGFGAARFHGSTGGVRLARPIVGMAADPATGGYWMVAADGGVFSFDAPFFGSMGGRPLDRPIVGMAATPDGGGYWLVASDGGVFSFGDARFLGSTGGIRLSRPVVGMAVAPGGGGYWMVASDGGVFAFGGARFRGSTGGVRLTRPVVGMAGTNDGGGYWLVAADGGVFNFGSAPFLGSGA